jgi:O-antigen/teichoic acid export membrane protein
VARVPGPVPIAVPARSPGPRSRPRRLVRQNTVLLAGGVVSGVGGFAYHAIAGRILGPELYGEVASAIAAYTILSTPYFVLVLVLAHCAATLLTERDPAGIRALALRTSAWMALPGAALVGLAVAFAGPAAAFLQLGSPLPMVWLGMAVAVTWQLAIPRALLQGMQRFGALSLNLTVEMVARSGSMLGLLLAGFAVAGGTAALLVGALLSLGLGVGALRDVLVAPAGGRARLGGLAGLSISAAAGTVGVLLLYNLDVVLAKHFLDAQGAGLYGGLNKVAGIVFFLTLSVSQVMFPTVVEAVRAGRHPGRLLLLSGLLLCLLSLVPLAAFTGEPRLVVGALFGPAFEGAAPLLPLAGLIGLGLSLDNLLIQFFVALRDRWFIPVLLAGCALEAVLISLHHRGVGAVVLDVLLAMFVLLLLLAARAMLLLGLRGPAALPASGTGLKHEGTKDTKTHKEPSKREI